MRTARLVLALSGSLAVAAASAAPLQEDPPRPNVVIVIADDLGYGDVGVYGATDIATPRLDAMAAEGMLATAFYTQVSCSPTRAALMTGAYSPRVDVISPMGAWSDRGLAPSEHTLAEMLRDAGYATGFFGKWHLGDSPDQMPEGQGFDDALTSAWGLPARPHLLVDASGPDVTDDDPVTWTRRFVARTQRFIETSVAADRPFFVVLSHITPHLPATPSPEFVGVSADGREYGDSVEEIDATTGEILDRLDALGVGDDTLVLFLSDNGPALGQGAYQAGSAGGLRGGKGSTFEGGIRSPFIARWPARIPAGSTSGELMHVVDLFDTLAALSEATLPPGLPVRDGVDVSPILLGGQGDPARVVHHFRGFDLEAVRRGPWKLRDGELFNVEFDPSETVDLAALNPAIRQQLEQLRASKEADVLGAIRPRALTARRSPQWRADFGLSGGTQAGARWRDRLMASEPWLFVDPEPSVDFEVVPTDASIGAQLPGSALRVSSLVPALKLVRPGDDFGVSEPGQPFSFEAWFRSPTDDPEQDGLLFDCGAGASGSSITIGDAGVMGDDPAPGRRDDVVVRLGGLLSPSTASLVFDLPSGARGWSDRFVHLVVTYDGDGVARAWVNGFVRAEETAPGLDAGLEFQWALFGRAGEVGGSAGAGVMPFDAHGFVGEVAQFRAFDRALVRKDVEIALCRHVAYSYCAPLPGPNGNRLRFDLAGDFRTESRIIRVELDGAPPGTPGILLASRDQTRTELFGEFLCVNRRIALDARPFTIGGTPGPQGGTFRLLATLPFDPDPGSTWNFQVWTRLNGVPRVSNALNMLFCF